MTPPATGPPARSGAAAHSCGAAVADWSRYCTGSERIGQSSSGISRASVTECLHEWHIMSVKGPPGCFTFRIHCETIVSDVREILKTSTFTAQHNTHSTGRHILQEGYESEILMIEFSIITLLTRSSEPALCCACV
jgi:hypothetical protein